MTASSYNKFAIVAHNNEIPPRYHIAKHNGTIPCSMSICEKDLLMHNIPIACPPFDTVDELKKAINIYERQSGCKNLICHECKEILKI